MIAIDDIKKEFIKTIDKPVTRLYHETFQQVNSNFEIIQLKMCKHCHQKASKNCCDLYNNFSNSFGIFSILLCLKYNFSSPFGKFSIFSISIVS